MNATEKWLEEWLEEWLEQEHKAGKMTEKQRRILMAATEIFAEKGYAAASTSEIAQKAGVAEGTIFRHYKTKKDLLLSIIAPAMAKLFGPLFLRDFAKMLDQPYETYEEFLKALFYNRYEYARDNLSIVKIIIQEVPFHPELREKVKAVAEDMIISRFRRIIDNYKEKGMLDSNLPTPAIIRFMISNMVGLVASMLVIMPEKDWDVEKELETTIQMMMRGLAGKG